MIFRETYPIQEVLEWNLPDSGGNVKSLLLVALIAHQGIEDDVTLYHDYTFNVTVEGANFVATLSIELERVWCGGCQRFRYILPRLWYSYSEVHSWVAHQLGGTTVTLPVGVCPHCRTLLFPEVPDA